MDVNSSGRTETPSRWRRVLRWVVRGLVGALAVIGLLSLVLSRPTVGQFRTPEGKRSYATAYAAALATMPTPTQTVDVPTDYGTVRAYVWRQPRAADRTPVLLLPGRTSGVPMWSENLPAIAAKRTVIAVDALGDAGLSIQSVPMTAPEDQAVWIDQVVAELAPGGVHVLGHSFGGATAATYARLHPEHVRSLALLEPVFTFGYPSARMMGWAMLGSLPFLPASLRERALTEIGGGEEPDPADPITTMITAGADHHSPELPTPKVLTDDQLAHLTLPTYVAIADHDSLAGGEKAAERAAGLPNGTVRVWPNTTHSLPMQVSEQLSAELDQFWGR